MAGVGIQVNDREIQAALGGMSRYLRGEMMPEIAGLLESRTVMRFETQTDPDGNPWQPSIRVQKFGGQTLSLHGHLRDSVTSQSTPDKAIVGSVKKYLATHQFGAVIRPKQRKTLAFMVGGKPVFARKVVIPARPVLGLGDADREAVLRAVSDALTRRWLNWGSV